MADLITAVLMAGVGICGAAYCFAGVASFKEQRMNVTYVHPPYESREESKAKRRAFWTQIGMAAAMLAAMFPLAYWLGSHIFRVLLAIAGGVQ